MAEKSYMQHLFEQEKRHLRELHLTITAKIGKAALAERDAEIYQQNHEYYKLIDCVTLNPDGQPKNLDYLDQYCDNIRSFTQSYEPLATALYMIAETAMSVGYPKTARQHIATLFLDLMHDRHAADNFGNQLYQHAHMIAGARI